ncbi:MAG: hypothetical protein ACK56I_34100, partial [bacterium]
MQRDGGVALVDLVLALLARAFDPLGDDRAQVALEPVARLGRERRRPLRDLLHHARRARGLHDSRGRDARAARQDAPQREHGGRVQREDQRDAEVRRLAGGLLALGHRCGSRPSRGRLAAPGAQRGHPARRASIRSGPKLPRVPSRWPEILATA